MQKTSFSLEQRHIDLIDEYGPEDESRAESLRKLLDEFDELRDRVGALEDDLERERARADDLRRQLREANSTSDDVDDLAEYVREERRAEQRVREASILTRAKWALVGMPPDDEE